VQQLNSLATSYQDLFSIGTCVNTQNLRTHRELIIKHFNSITAENEMKFESLHPEEGVYTFEAADQIIQFAEDNYKLVRGHTLVWHNQTPKWVFHQANGQYVTREQLLERMKDHITTVVKRYREHIFCWDVVNEAIEDKTDKLLRTSPWLEIIGPDFIEKAFIYAHEADPQALLFYNDYGESAPQKRDKIVQLVTDLIAKGIPVHGIGLQCHWNIYGPNISQIREAIEKYAALGLQIHITELDMSVYSHDDQRTDLTEPTTEMLDLLAERYESVFGLFREYADVITNVTFWGPADDQSWLQSFPVRSRKNWPLLFDYEQKPKKAFYKIIDFAK